MSTDASYDTKLRIKQAIDIVDLVGSYLQLQRSGRIYKALCPWHDDTRPSLQVNQERQSFKCWVCNIGGDVFTFVERYENVSFREALALLAERAGVPLHTGRPSGRTTVAAADDKPKLLKAHQWAVEQFHRCLVADPAAAPARQYLAERHLTDESIRGFRLGFSPGDWEWLLKQTKGTPYTAADLEAVGLAVRRRNGPGHFDRFKDRVLFPIFDLQGRAVGLGGRVLPELAPPDAAKYINTPDSPLFSKHKLLYGLDLAKDAIRKQQTALVMEGYTDVIVAHQCGFANAVAVLGTALGREQIRLLKSFGERVRIVLVLDGDEAGRKRTKEVLELFVAERADLRVLTLPDQLDPCEFLLARGSAALATLVDAAVDGLEHAFQSATAGLDLAGDVHAASVALEELVSTIAKAPRPHAQEDHLREQSFLVRLARSFRIPEEEVRKRLSAVRQKGVARPAAAASTLPPSPAERLDPLERELLELLVRAPAHPLLVEGLVELDHLQNELARRLFARWRQLTAAGVLADQPRLLLEFDDAEIKTVLVELDDLAARKPLDDVTAAIRDVAAALERRRHSSRRHSSLAALKDGKLAEDDALALLRQIELQEKTRHGISAPTDG